MINLYFSIFCVAVGWRCEPVWYQIHHTDPSGQSRRYHTQSQCRTRLCGEICLCIGLLSHSPYQRMHLLIGLQLKSLWFFCISLLVPFESERLIFSLSRQGFTYVAPSVLESLKEGFSFEPRTRPVRRHNSSPRTPIRWSLSISFDLWTVLSIYNCT